MRKLILFLMLALILPGFPGKVHATVTNGTNQVVYNGDGITSVFPFSFNVYNSASENDLVVQKYNTTTGAITDLAINTDYTVSLLTAIPSAGSITLVAGVLPVGTNLSILRQLPLTQTVSESDNSATPASVRNNVYDRNIMIAQQLQNSINLAVLQNAFSSTSVTLPLAVTGKCLGWSGSDLANLDCSGGGGGGGNYNPPIDDSQILPITTANKVNGSAIYSLSSIPSGAGMVPIANLNVGTTASKLVQLTAAAKYPAVDGSLITKISGANFLSLSSTPSLAGIIPVANLGSGSPSSSNFLRGDGTFASASASFVPNNIQVFSTPGTATWTKPAGITSVYVKVWGAGGGGGAATASNSFGGGGGGGGYSEGTTAVTTNVTVTVGAAGSGSTGGSNGTAGGTSSFAGSTTIQATGGAAGADVSTGGAGGVGSNGTINFSGLKGQDGVDGGATIVLGMAGGAGGGTFAFAGPQPTPMPSFAQGTANNGDGIGTGGSGGSAITATSVGGNGQSGMVIVYY